MTALVLGVGNPDRGDDGIGPHVARRVAALALPGVRVVERVEPTDLPDAWEDAETVVIVDAAHTGRPPGTVLVRDAVARPLPAGGGSGGTHAFGVTEAVELARALGRLPAALTVVSVEAGEVGIGQPLSDAARAAVTTAAQTVVTALEPVAGDTRGQS